MSVAFIAGRVLVRLGFLCHFCQKGGDVIAGITTCLGILQQWVAALREGRCLKTEEGHDTGD